MKSLKVDDLVEIIKSNDIENDISCDFVGKFAYINKIDGGIAEIQITASDITFWIPLDYLRLNRR